MHYLVFPEVAGGLGPKSVIDNSTFPPVVTTLNYQFDGWLGDDLIETFPCFVVTERLKNALNESGLKGFLFSNVLATKSSTFDDLYPGKELPNFYWLQINGKLKQDDISITGKGELVISSQAKDLLSKFNISHSDIRKYE